MMRKCDHCKGFFDSARKRKVHFGKKGSTYEETPDMKKVICNSGISSRHSMLI